MCVKTLCCDIFKDIAYAHKYTMYLFVSERKCFEIHLIGLPLLFLINH